MRRFAFIYVSTPQESDYKKILETHYLRLEFEAYGFGAVSSSELLKMMGRTFCEEGVGLSGIGLQVGAAIPVDCLKHIASTFAVYGSEGCSCQELLLATFKSYLFPQFEGKDERHEEIRGAISSALALDANKLQDLDNALAMWTGYVPQRYL